MKKLLLLAFAAFALAACSEDQEPPLTPPSDDVPVTGVTLDRNDAALAPGQTLQLVATVAPADATDPVFSWASEDQTVATVSTSGLITAHAEGVTTIRVVCSGFKAECEVTVAEPTQTISFEADEQLMGIDGEAVALRTVTVVSGPSSAQFNNVYWAKEYTEANDLRDDYDQRYFAAPFFSTSGSDIWFSSYYCDCMMFGDQYDAWGGFILSSNTNKTTAAGMDNQFEVYADGGANGSSVFAACYDAKAAGMAMSADCCWPQIDFTDGARSVLSVSLANSTWTYNYFSGDAADRYAVKITGSKDDVETGSVECVLIDGATKVGDWTAVDLSSLGEVDRLTFRVVCADKIAPCYFGVDDVVLKK